MEAEAQKIGQLLLGDQNFLQKLRVSMQAGHAVEGISIKELIAEITGLLESLIRLKIEQQLKEIMLDNNRVLQQIKDNMLRQSEYRAADISFSEVHRIITDQRRKFDVLTGDSEEADITAADLKFETIEEKMSHIEKKLKAIEQKFDTNLKGLWNVLSETEGAVHKITLIQRNEKKLKPKQQNEQEPRDMKKGILKFFRGN